MSQPGDPYRDPRRGPYQPPRGPQQPYQQQPRPYQGQGYEAPRYEAPRREQTPWYDEPLGHEPPRRYEEPRQYRADARPPSARRPAEPPHPVPRPGGGPRRIPGLGLVLTGLSLVVQVLSLFVLPWVRYDAASPVSLSMPNLFDAAKDVGAHGFGAQYVVLFSYPLAALGIVLALATVLDSVVLKVIWGGLTVVGLGALVLRFGLGPFAGVVLSNKKLDFTRQELTTAVIAVAALVVVIFMLKTALSMFRRMAGLILLGLAGLHVWAVVDLVKGSSAAELGIGAYGPAVGYVLVAVAAFLGPRRLPGV